MNPYLYVFITLIPIAVVVLALFLLLCDSKPYQRSDSHAEDLLLTDLYRHRLFDMPSDGNCENLGVQRGSSNGLSQVNMLTHDELRSIQNELQTIHHHAQKIAEETVYSLPAIDHDDEGEDWNLVNVQSALRGVDELERLAATVRRKLYREVVR